MVVGIEKWDPGWQATAALSLSRVYTLFGLAAFLVCAACGEDIPRYAHAPFSTDRPAPGPFNGLLVATNFGEDTLSLVDPDSMKERFRVPLGLVPVELEGPHHVSVDPAGQFLYVNLALSVPGSGSGPHGVHGNGEVPGYLVKISTQNGRVMGQARIDRNPGENAISADGRTVYVSHFDLLAWARSGEGDNPGPRKGDSRIAVVDTQSMTVRRFVPVCPAAHGIALSRDGATLYVACSADEIATVDTQDVNAQVQRFLLPGAREDTRCEYCPYALTVAPDDRVFVASTGASLGAHGRGRVDIFDPRTKTFDDALALPFFGRPLFPVVLPGGTADGFTLVVPEQGGRGDWVRFYSVAKVGRPVETGAIPLFEECTYAHAVLPLPDGKRAAVVCEGDHKKPGSVVWLDLQTRRVIGSVEVGVFPDDLDLVPHRKDSL